MFPQLPNLPLRRTAAFAVVFVSALLIFGCRYDKQETLIKPVVTGCDSLSTVSFSATVFPIIAASCNQANCHPDNGSLEDYAHIKSRIDQSNLKKRINWASGVPAMPAAQKLNSCNLAKINKWINDGYPNN